MTATATAQTQDYGSSPFVRMTAPGVFNVELAVRGIRCAGCIGKIERGVGLLPGVEDARVNMSTAKLSVRWRDPRLSVKHIVEKVQDLGFDAFPYDPGAMLRQDDEQGRRLLRALAVSGFAASNVMFLSICVWAGYDGEMGEATRTLFHWLSGLVAVPAALYSGRIFFESAVSSLKRHQANMDVPISLGIVLALGLSIAEALQGGRYTYFDAAVSLPFLLLIGRYLDHLLRLRAFDAARALAAMQTVTAQRFGHDGTLRDVLASEIAPGDRLLIRTGERAAVDGVIEEGESEVDVSLVTGESVPVRLRVSDQISAGSLLLGPALQMSATARVQDSLVAEIARLMEVGQQSRGRYVRWADQAARLYVPVVHGLAFAVFAGGAAFGVSLHDALTNAIALLIITCPCALGLAVPAVQVVATSRLLKRGMLVKSGDALERLAQIDVVVFDKTGTLTEGRPALVNAGTVSRDVLLQASQLARASLHPLARALVECAGPGPIASHVEDVAGLGVRGIVEGQEARLGSVTWVGGGDAALHDGMTVWFRRGDGTAVCFEFSDRLKADAVAVVQALKGRHVDVELLSGDRERVVFDLARRAGIDRAFAEVDPLHKVAHLEALKAQGRYVLMAGDGLNDAAALAMAHVSVSPSRASDLSRTASDFVLQGEHVSPIVEALDVARAARRLVFQNFAFAAIYNAVAVPLAAMGLVTPLIAAVAMSGSSLLVMVNALRLAQRR